MAVLLVQGGAHPAHCSPMRLPLGQLSRSQFPKSEIETPSAFATCALLLVCRCWACPRHAFHKKSKRGAVTLGALLSPAAHGCWRLGVLVSFGCVFCLGAPADLRATAASLRRCAGTETSVCFVLFGLGLCCVLFWLVLWRSR